MACAWLREIEDGEPELPPALAAAVEPRRWRNCLRQIEAGLGSPPTSSVGRLFDAVGALCGAPARVSYEGQAAVELEAMADPAESGAYELPLRGEELDPLPALAGVLADLAAGVEPARVAARFHNGVAAATATALAELAAARAVDLVVLSGGVFQNRLLLERTLARLEPTGLRVLVPERLPPNDGGISFGQAAVAAARSI
jgi:hydrogenase maturation protein HypF